MDSQQLVKNDHANHIAVCPVNLAYLDISVSDIVVVSVLETLKDRLQDMTDFFFAHVDAIRVRVEIGLGQLHHKVELRGSLDHADHFADARLKITNEKRCQRAVPCSERQGKQGGSRTYSFLQVVNEPRLIKQAAVLDLLHRVLVDESQAAVHGLVDDLDGQVLSCGKINALVHIRVMTLAEDLVLEQFVGVHQDLGFVQPIVLGLQRRIKV